MEKWTREYTEKWFTYHYQVCEWADRAGDNNCRSNVDDNECEYWYDLDGIEKCTETECGQEHYTTDPHHYDHLPQDLRP